MGPGRKFQAIHQPIDGSQPRAETAGRGKSVSQRAFDIHDSGSVILRRDLNSHASRRLNRAKVHVALAGVFKEVRGQFGYSQSDLLALDSGKTERRSELFRRITGGFDLRWPGNPNGG